jgi:hypothetical protein
MLQARKLGSSTSYLINSTVTVLRYSDAHPADFPRFFENLRDTSNTNEGLGLSKLRPRSLKNHPSIFVCLMGIIVDDLSLVEVWGYCVDEAPEK